MLIFVSDYRAQRMHGKSRATACRTTQPSNRMKKTAPLELAIENVYRTGIPINPEHCFINPKIGVINRFAVNNPKHELFNQPRPFRITEGRIIRVTQGEATVSINLMTNRIKPRHVLIVPAGSIIQLEQFSPDIDLQMIAPANDFLPEFQRSLDTRQHSLFPLSEADWHLCDTFFSLLWDTVRAVPFRGEAVRHLVMALLTNLLSIQENIQATEPRRLSRQEDIHRRFLRLVNKHCKTERSVAFYADQLYLTPRYLSTVIREASGQTPMQWINQAVILEAKVMLRHSDLLVFQIADELHFPNPSFFSKFFKRMTGMTPQEYQRGE